ncbi:hypothetical protein B0H11DRAFT_2297044 [Mycena galericulata]|nr:hypothetical protein B0H11DRAFT_2297044 [Mycena galericulata]
MRFFALATAASVLSSASAATILVTVGAGNTTTYSPSNVTAQVGDQIAFQFVSGNHTVTQSSFPAPCTALPPPGISSGFQPVTAGAQQIPQWSFNVTNATTPLWFFCEHVGHCAKGMVFSVNAPATGKTFSAFQEAAIGTGSSASGSASAPGASGTAGTHNSALTTRTGSVGVLAVAAGVVAGLLL